MSNSTPDLHELLPEWFVFVNTLLEDQLVNAGRDAVRWHESGYAEVRIGCEQRIKDLRRHIQTANAFCEAHGLDRKLEPKPVSCERASVLLHEMNAYLALPPTPSPEFRAGYHDTVLAHINGKRVKCPYPKTSAACDAFWYGYETARKMIQRVGGES